MNTTELVVENKTWKKIHGPYGIWTHDLFDTGAVCSESSHFMGTIESVI